MIDRINSLINVFDIGDIKFLYLVIKKNLKNLVILSIIVSLLVLIISLNQEKKFMSKATIVIEPDENKIVNIEEVYSIESKSNRINNQMAILKSDEVLEYIVADKKNILLRIKKTQQNLKICILKQNKMFFKESSRKKKRLIALF